MSQAKLKLPENKNLNIEYLESILNQDSTFQISNVFNPLVSKLITYNNKRSFLCNVDLFRKKFNVDNDNFIFDFMDSLNESGCSPILAGGKLISWINGERNSDNDFDLFFISENDYAKFYDYAQRSDRWKNTADTGYLSEWVVDEKHKIQLINKMFSNIEDITESFDLRCCCVAYYQRNLIWLTGAIKEIKKKTLSINAFTLRAPGTMRRILKYVSRGYTIQMPDLLCVSALLIDNVIGDLTCKDQEYLGQYFDRKHNHERTSQYDIWLNPANQMIQI